MSCPLTWWRWKRVAVKGGRWQAGNARPRAAAWTPSPPISSPDSRPPLPLITVTAQKPLPDQCAQPQREARSIAGLSWKRGGKWESDDGSGNVGVIRWAVRRRQCPRYVHVAPPLITVMNSREHAGTGRDPQAAICLISTIYKWLQPSSDQRIHHGPFHLPDCDSE